MIYLARRGLFVSILIGSLLVSANTFAADDVQAIVDEIQALAEKSRNERAADRWLQLALEDLVNKYNFPWKNSLLSDDFSDGDYTSGVAWTVGSGDFWVDRRLGLRSEVVASTRQPEPSQPAQPQRRSDEDIGRALLGAFLQEALGPQRDTEPAQSQQRQVEMEKQPASIRTALPIPTTFAVEAIFSQNNRPGDAGQFEWLVMQDSDGSNAYKVSISTGQKGMLDVVRVRGGKSSYIETVEIPALNDSGEHTLSWRQKADGAIDVFVDGQQVVKATDKAFRYGFKYLGMVNRSGDFSVSGVEVLGGQ